MRAAAAADEAHLHLEAGRADELIDGRLERRREAGDVIVPDEEPARVGDLCFLPLQEFPGRVLRLVAIDRVVVRVAEKEKVVLAVELVVRVARVMARAGGLGRADVRDLDRDGPMPRAVSSKTRGTWQSG